MKIFGYGASLERPQMKTWRGVKVPFCLWIRIHYPTGSRIWKYLIGPNYFEWAKKVARGEIK